MKSSPDIGIKEVAKRANVGIASVSRVFSGQTGVSEKMRKRVLQAAAKLNYEPNMLAQALRRRTTRTVGFVGSDITNPLLASIVNGAEAILTEAGYTILLTNSGNQPSLDAKHIRLLLRRQVDGLILLPATEDDPAFLAALERTTVPVVVIDRTLPSTIKARYVLSDHYAGVGEATQYLLKLGHRRIAIIVGGDVRPSRERVRAVQDAYTQKGLKPTFVVDHGALSAEHGASALTRLLDSPKPPTAIILGGNQLLEGALSVVRSKMIELGRDLSLVSCDDLPLSRFFEKPISTVMRDVDLIGKISARMLLGSMGNGHHREDTQTLTTWFDPRLSCGKVRKS